MDQQIKDLASKAYDLKQIELQAKADFKDIKEEIIELGMEYYNDHDYMLPMTSIEIPSDFWDLIDMDVNEFVESRFPGWDIEHIKEGVIILKKNPRYLSEVYDLEEEHIRVSKQVDEYPPDIDWDTLFAEKPQIAKRLAKKIISYELDEEVYDDLMEEIPELPSIIRRHCKVKKPVIKLVARKIKDG